MPQNPKAKKPNASAPAKPAVLSLNFDQRDQVHDALHEIEAALRSLFVLYDYCEAHDVHRTPLMALHAATTAIKGPHARLQRLLDAKTPDAQEEFHVVVTAGDANG
jgi:hypothetical protein